MRAKIELTLDTEKGDWEMRVHNLSSPGKDIDYNEIKPVLEKIFSGATTQIVNGIESDERVFREIH